MSNKEWTDLIAKEFKVNNSIAKEMLHAMMTIKKNKDKVIRIEAYDGLYDEAYKNQ